jgi:hypothetical protein
MKSNCPQTIEIDGDEEVLDCFMQLSSKHNFTWEQMFKQMVSQYQLVDEGIYKLTPNMDHPSNKHLKCAPENE